MIFKRKTPDAWHAKNSARVAKWRSSFRAKRERLLPQWKAECEWHPWFAWYPVFTINSKWVWLSFVEYHVDHVAQRINEISGLPHYSECYYTKIEKEN